TGDEDVAAREERGRARAGVVGPAEAPGPEAGPAAVEAGHDGVAVIGRTVAEERAAAEVGVTAGVAAHEDVAVRPDVDGTDRLPAVPGHDPEPGRAAPRGATAARALARGRARERAVRSAR